LAQARRVAGHIFKFIGYYINVFCKRLKRREVMIARNRVRITNLKRRTVFFRCENMAFESKLARRKRQHAPQLPAAQNANR
jgi:hypothetical protein